jgi:hypothetical protein
VSNPDGHIEVVEDDYVYDVYVTGTNQRLSNLHPKSQCEGEACVIHNPSDHSMRSFPTHWRGDRGLMERICPHGVGHPDPDDMSFKQRIMSPENARAEGIHGCDGCCMEGELHHD